MSLSNVPDYLTLHKSDAIDNSDVYSWNVPQSYYTSARGNVCFVSLVSASVDDAEDSSLVVKYHGGQNAINTKNDGNVLGVCYLSTSATNPNYMYDSAENIKLLIQARPSTISLSLVGYDNAVKGITNGIFTLKFDYLNEDEVARDYSNTLYNKLN